MMTDEETRALELETVVDATADEVWEALTTGEGLRKWFPLDAKVKPGEGGSIWLSWGPGCEGEAPIRVWEPGRRFGWTESYGEDAAGRPIQVAVDFHVEGRDGTTVVRLVHSGFDTSSDWDDMYDALKDGWTYFLFNLRHYFDHHAGAPRRMVWRRAPTALPRDEVWRRLVDSGLVRSDEVGTVSQTADHHGAFELPLDRPHAARMVSARPRHHFAATLPDLGESVFFVELEGAHVGFWLSTYGLEPGTTDVLQSALDGRIREALGEDTVS